jgi:hypothetical protein
LRALAAVVTLGLSTLAVASDSNAGSDVHIAVLMEHGIGTAAQAQPYVDELVAIAKDKNGWSSAEGKYLTRREQAAEYVDKNSADYGILSLGAFLAWRTPRSLEVLGVADVARAGGRQYHLISKSESGLAGCKGKTLATNHAVDPRFINKVVSGGAFKLADFTLVETKRPVQTIKKVSSGDAACALIDDAQLSELSHIDGTSGISSVWKSAQLPPMAVVAFSGTSAAERAKFKASLGSLCSGQGKSTCDKVGIRSFKSAGESEFSAVIAQYDK